MQGRRGRKHDDADVGERGRGKKNSTSFVALLSFSLPLFPLFLFPSPFSPFSHTTRSPPRALALPRPRPSKERKKEAAPARSKRSRLRRVTRLFFFAQKRKKRKKVDLLTLSVFFSFSFENLIKANGALFPLSFPSAHLFRRLSPWVVARSPFPWCLRSAGKSMRERRRVVGREASGEEKDESEIARRRKTSVLAPRSRSLRPASGLFLPATP